MKSKSKNLLFVKSFVQKTSSVTTTTKRYKSISQILDSGIKFTPEERIYVWRGFYYALWYTEMGHGCEQMATKIASCDDVDMMLTGFESLARDWFGIDAYRVDKYFYLVRAMIKTCIKMQLNAITNENNDDHNFIDDDSKNDVNVDKNKDENKDNGELDTMGSNENNVKEINNKNSVESEKKLKNRRNKINKRAKSKKEATPISFPVAIRAKLIDDILVRVKKSLGLSYHVTDIYLDELVKVLNERRLKSDERCEIMFVMLVPFIKFLALSDDDRLISSIREDVFIKLKDETIISESIEARKTLLCKLKDAMISMGGVQDVAKKNRHHMYSIANFYKTKLSLLSSHSANVKKRKITEKVGKRKKIRYEATSASPFVRSIVPIAVV